MPLALPRGITGGSFAIHRPAAAAEISGDADPAVADEFHFALIETAPAMAQIDDAVAVDLAGIPGAEMVEAAADAAIDLGLLVEEGATSDCAAAPFLL